MLTIPDVGPKTVARLWKELKITDVAKLEKADAIIFGSPTYMAGRELLRLAEPLDRWGRKLRRSAGRTVRGLRANTGRSRGG